MSDPNTPATGAEMSTAETLTGIFFEPSRTFEALRARPRFLVAGLIVFILTCLVTAALYARVDMAQFIRDRIEQSPRAAQVSEELGRESIPMLIANKGLVFFYKFQWMREAFPYEPEKHWDKTRVWRLTDGITPDELFYYTPEECRWDSGLTKALNTPGYSLIREDCYEKFRSNVTEATDPDLYQRVWRSWLNPSLHRPNFLYPKHAEDTEDEFPALPPKKIKSSNPRPH